MRKYIRHPSSIPIEVTHVAHEHISTESLNNVSFGGLSFRSKEAISLGQLIKIHIPLIDPPFEALAKVVWCEALANGFDVGVELDSEDDAYRARMIEQVCHIESYKQQVLFNEGRRLSGADAALEWIEKYAHEFPKIDEVESS